MGSYKNAGDILPPRLLKAVQQYAEGQRLYIPTRSKRRPWGEATGIRAELAERNALICEQYRAGATPDWLASEHALSVDSIRRIVRGTRRD